MQIGKTGMIYRRKSHIMLKRSNKVIIDINMHKGVTGEWNKVVVLDWETSFLCTSIAAHAVHLLSLVATFQLPGKILALSGQYQVTFSCPTSGFTCPGPSGSGKRRALGANELISIYFRGVQTWQNHSSGSGRPTSRDARTQESCQNCPGEVKPQKMECLISGDQDCTRGEGQSQSTRSVFFWHSIDWREIGPRMV